MHRKEESAFYERYHADKEDDKYLTEREPTLQKRLALFFKVVRPGDQVLDFGCGGGTIIGNLNRRVSIHPDSLGVDISETAIRRARERFAEINFDVLGAGGRINVPSGFFNVLVTSEVIEHVLDTEKMWDEFNRVLKPGGILALTCPYHGWLKDLTLLLVGRSESHFHDPFNQHIRHYSLKALKKRVFPRYRFVFQWSAGVGRCRWLWKSMFVVAKRGEE